MSALHPRDGDRDDDQGQQFRAGFHIGIRREVNVVHGVSTLQCEDDIMDLKKQLIDKDKEIEDLRKRVKELEGKNNDLEFQLQNKCDEVNKLNKRINKLEDEKRSLEKDLASVKHTLKTVEENVDELSSSKEAQELTNFELERNMRKVTTSLKDVEEQLTRTTEKNKQLEAEIQEVRKQQRYVQGAPALRLPLPAEEQHLAMKALTQMACFILSAMYKFVLPDHYTSVINYTVAMIEKDIQRLPKTDKERSEANKKWEKLKKDLSWSEDKTEILRTLHESRNSIDWGSQDLNEQLLRDCTNYLHQENILKGWLNVDHITGLIEVWKRLNCSTNLDTKN